MKEQTKKLLFLVFMLFVCVYRIIEFFSEYRLEPGAPIFIVAIFSFLFIWLATELVKAVKSKSNTEVSGENKKSKGVRID